MTHIVVLYALIATLGTWSVTALGAATVIFFRKQNQGALNLMLGFAAGVMIAASFLKDAKKYQAELETYQNK